MITIHEDTDGHIDQTELAAQLEAHADRPLKTGTFSAASNVTGILSDVRGIASLLHAHGALRDYAACAPYVTIDISAPVEHPDGSFGEVGACAPVCGGTPTST